MAFRGFSKNYEYSKERRKSGVIVVGVYWCEEKFTYLLLLFFLAGDILVERVSVRSFEGGSEEAMNLMVRRCPKCQGIVGNSNVYDKWICQRHGPSCWHSSIAPEGRSEELTEELEGEVAQRFVLAIDIEEDKPMVVD